MTERVAVVTNVTAYAGPGSVGGLLEAGYRVLGHDPSFESEAARREFELGHPAASAYPSKSVNGVVGHAIKQWGQLDVLVCNDVLPLQYQPVEELEAGDIRRAADALVTTPMTLTARAAVEMKRRGGGAIVLITSAAPSRPEPGFSIYSSLRAAASAFAQAAARELAPHRITVNAIAPNFLESELYYPDALWGTAEGRAKLERLLPMGRLGSGRELGALVAFLANGTAGFLTGEVVKFAGGWP
ncbi:MAG: SDR family oxidoreductase [Myxococcales bacterium]|nr:SDR family oxidoreductase [Myxococcales bacterium]HRC56832.1 SDR family oxidoreductase [Kofleriaceae bacterium]